MPSTRDYDYLRLGSQRPSLRTPTRTARPARLRIRGYFLYGGPVPATDDPHPPHPADARLFAMSIAASCTTGVLRMGMALARAGLHSAERNPKTTRSLDGLLTADLDTRGG